jgi:hypothetical protein
MIEVVVWVERDAEQAALTAGVDGQVQSRRGRAITAGQLDVACLFENKQPAVGCELHVGRTAQARAECAFREPGR